MIVTCEECSTSFQLDETRIPETGARVRCSRCKHAFFVSNPSTSASAAVDSIAQAAAAEEAAGPPWPAEDLPGPVAGPPASSPPPAETQEEVWEFSEEIRSESDDDLDSNVDFDQSFDASVLPDEGGNTGLDTNPAADEPVGMQAETDFPTEAGVDESEASGVELPVEPEGPEVGVEASVEAGHDESSFGSVDDFSSLMEDEDSDDSPGKESGSSLVSGDDVDAGAAIPGLSAHDLGEPESWDLTGDADSARPRASTAGSNENAWSGNAAAQTADRASESFPVQYAEDMGEASVFGRLLLDLGNFVGWLITIAAVAIVAYLNLELAWPRLEPTPQSLSIGSVVAATTDSGWIETTRSGSLLIVNGLVTNTGGRAIRPPNLWLNVLDDNGQRIMSAGVAVGRPLAESILREASPGQLERAAIRARQRFAGAPMRAGEERAFQAVIGQMPQAAGRMLLEVVEAQASGSTARPGVKITHQARR